VSCSELFELKFLTSRNILYDDKLLKVGMLLPLLVLQSLQCYSQAEMPGVLPLMSVSATSQSN